MVGDLRSNYGQDKFCIQGPTKLSGSVFISGAKNSVLPILFLTLLTEESIELKNVPNLKDVDVVLQLLNAFGACIIFRNNSVFISTRGIDCACIPSDELMGSIRASVWILAPLLARYGQGTISFPGGCVIGSRPIDLHIHGLRKLGAFIFLDGKYLKASVNGRLKGAYIKMNKFSVGATITVMSAATLAVGSTIIDGASCEPEVVDVANFLLCWGRTLDGLEIISF